MAKKALCVKSIEDVSNIINDSNSILDAMLVDREICEKPENGYLQIIPYVTFYNLDLKTGFIKFIQYKRASKITEERLSAKTSIGFGGHIDSDNDIDADASYTENGITNYKLNNKQFIKTIINSAKRELVEELGKNILNVTNFNNKEPSIVFFMGDPDVEVNKVHLGVSISIPLTDKQFYSVFKEADINPDEIEKINYLNFDLASILENFDISYSLFNVVNEINRRQALEDWSIKVFYYICGIILNKLKSKVNYDDLIKLIFDKMEEEFDFKGNVTLQ